MKQSIRLFISWILCLSIILLTIIVIPIKPYAASEYFAGDGTESSPYLVSSSEQLSQMSVLINTGDSAYNSAYFMQSCDIDLSGIENWTPIGKNSACAFYGLFDGNGYQIIGLQMSASIDSLASEYFGLFGYNSGTVKSVGIADCDIVELPNTDKPYQAYVGGIAGINSGSIRNCSVKGELSGGSCSGGLVGKNSSGSIMDCASDASVSAANYLHVHVGGITGYNDSGSITRCFNTGLIYGISEAAVYSGGIAGYDYRGAISDCFNLGSISGDDGGTEILGGIAGYASEGSSVNNCYNAGLESGAWGTNAYVGGIVGVIESPVNISNGYYLDIAAQGIGSEVGSTNSCSIEQMHQQTTFSGFDFDTVWVIPDNCTYPFPQLRSTAVTIKENTIDYNGGRGTVFDPYHIRTKQQLDHIRKNPDAYFVLDNDIVFSDDDFAASGEYYRDGLGWQPIGDFSQPFIGHFDGQGFQIIGLQLNGTVSGGSTGYFGLFGYTRGTVSNLGLQSCSVNVQATDSSMLFAGGIAGCNSGIISGCSSVGLVSASGTFYVYVGGIVGSNDFGLIDNCFNAMSVSGDDGSRVYSGGIAGRQHDATIRDSHNSGTVSGVDTLNIGGIVGENDVARIINCRNSGNVVCSDHGWRGGITGFNTGSISFCTNTGSILAGNLSTRTDYVGGIVGLNRGGIDFCYNAGQVESDQGIAGGIAGENQNGTISRCYNVGIVLSEDTNLNSGGIAGQNDGGTINDCYNIGTIIGSGNICGISGSNQYGSIFNCYYLNTTPKGIGTGDDPTVACTLEQMQQQATYVGFDFSEVWNLPNPYLYPQFRALPRGQYVVAFEDWDGSILALTTAENGEPAIVPAEPNRDGYVFVGWNVPINEVTADLNVVAQYAVACTVIFDKNGGDTDPDPVSMTTALGNPVTLPTLIPIRSGYHFTGWNTMTDGSGEAFTESTTVTSNIRVYAQWAINLYAVDFVSNGGTTVTSITAQHGAKISAPPAPTRTGHTFAGWFSDNQFMNPWDFLTNKVQESITLYAKWDVNIYEVTFVDWDDSILKTEQVAYNQSATPPDNPVRDGFSFSRWSQPYDQIIADIAISAIYIETQLTSRTLAINYEKKLIGPLSEGMAIDQLLQQLSNNSSQLLIKDRTGNEISDYNLQLTTGMTIMLVNQPDSLLTIAVKGDLTGDGVISALDLLQMKKYLLGQINLEGSYLEAGLATGNSSPSALDLLQIKKHLLGQITIK